MGKFKDFLSKSFTSVTIMVIPHSKQKPLRLRVSAIGLISCLILSVIGAGYVLSEGRQDRRVLRYEEKAFGFLLTGHGNEDCRHVSSEDGIGIRQTDFPQVKKEDSRADRHTSSDVGSIDIDQLKRQVNETIQSVAEIREYVKAEEISTGLHRRAGPCTGR